MTKKKQKIFHVLADLKLYVEIEIHADSFEDALEKARELTKDDLVAEVEDVDIQDSEIEITGVLG